MKLTLFTILTLLTLSGCSHILKLTKNEDKGVKDILNFYGGRCEYSVGFIASTTDGTKKYFELKLTGSDVAEKYFSSAPEFQVYGMAYMFFNDLKSENKNYDEIHSIVVLKNGQECQITLSRDTLGLIADKINVFNQVADLIKAKNFNGIKPLLNPDSYTDSAKNQLIYNLKVADSEFSNVKTFWFYGFRFENYNNYNVINFIGAFIRDKQDSQLSVKVDLKESEDNIHFLDYDWFSKEQN
jgi:hypothetical protein